MKKIIQIAFLQVILLFSGLLLPALIIADEADAMEGMSNQLKSVNTKLARGKFNGDDLSSWTKLTIKMKSTASVCVSNSESALLDKKSQIEGLGEKVKGEDPEVTKKRAAYIKEQDAINKTLAKCNLYISSAEEISHHIKDAEKYYFKQKYLVKSEDIIQLIVAWVNNPFALLANAGHFLFEKSGLLELTVKEILSSLLTIAVSIVTGFWLRRKLRNLEKKAHWQDDFSEKMVHALLTTLAKSSPYLLGSAAAAISAVLVTNDVAEEPFIAELFIGLLIYFTVTALIRFTFDPVPPAEQYLSLTPHIAESLARRLKVLAVLGLVGYLAFYTVFSESIVESNLLLMRNVFSFIAIINVIWTLQVIIKSPKMPRLRYISMLVIFILVLSLIAEWMGYRNMAYASRRVVLLTFIVFMVFIGLSALFRDLFNAIDNGTYPWTHRIHKTLGLEVHEKIPGLFWLRLLMSIVIWGGFAFIFISAWDYSGGVIEHARSYLVDGFDIGEFRIVPSKILWALLIFGLIIILSSWIRSQLENNWLHLTTMGQGAKDALVTIIGYVMFMIAILAGLSAAGFDFGNIAIIAGALSVGIGFGLQNIVNNFVSGLILLFERPIRKGDWIAVGGTEGYVKEIQIRSTRIQTFDRSDVIVPNSELISNQVTNWVLSSQSGRAIIPVGVAYGTDTEKVREILLDIAENNPDVAKSTVMPKPVVLFREFGDSSLNFELRVFLHNVDSRLSIISDINFAIDKAFKENDIEIPFPQRDLHVKNMPGNLPARNESTSIDKE